MRLSKATIFVAILLGIVVFLTLFPASGVSTDPPVCYAMFFYVVPCEPWVAPLAGALAVVLVGMALWTTDRRRAARETRA